MNTFRIVVTGWRGWPADLAPFIDFRLALEVAMNVRSDQRVTIAQGECEYGGVDAIARDFVQRSPYYSEGLLTGESWPADRDSAGRILGPARNTAMLAPGAQLCLAFPGPGSRGTWDCLTKAAKAGIETRIYPVEVARRWVLAHPNG